MVGPDEGSGDNRKDLPGLCGSSWSDTVRAAGTDVSRCGGEILAQGTRPAKCAPRHHTSSKIVAANKLDDPWGGCALLVACPQISASCPVLCNRLVHWLKALGNNRLEMVNGES